MDYAHEIFLRAFRKPARMRYDGLRPYGPYLSRIARNYRIDQLRRQEREVLTDVPPEAASGGEEEIAEAQHWNTLATATRGFVATLDEESRRFVTLRFENERSQAEVAEEMGVTRRRVRTLEGRVMKGLRRYLVREGLS